MTDAHATTLEHATAIVTGAASGIGRATCERLAAEGARVIAVDLNQGPLDELAQAIGAVAVTGDVSDLDLWDRVMAAVADQEPGGWLIAHLNAGVYGFTGPIDELPLDVFRRTTSTNIDGVVLGIRAVVPAMRTRGGGSIVVTASAAAIVAFEGNPLYTLTKQAVGGLVRALAPQLSVDGISIDAVCPGVVDTPMTVEATGGRDLASLPIPLIDPATIADSVVDLITTEGAGRCRAVRERGAPVDWTFPTWTDLARA